jgi:hypothetical protein
MRSPWAKITGSERFPNYKNSYQRVTRFVGSGGVTFSVSSLAASGLEIFTGSAAQTFAVAAIAGSGLEVFQGSAAVAFAVAAIAGSGAELFTGTVSISFAAPTISGIGTVATTAPLGGSSRPGQKMKTWRPIIEPPADMPSSEEDDDEAAMLESLLL